MNYKQVIEIIQHWETVAIRCEYTPGATTVSATYRNETITYQSANIKEVAYIALVCNGIGGREYSVIAARWEDAEEKQAHCPILEICYDYIKNRGETNLTHLKPRTHNRTLQIMNDPELLEAVFDVMSDECNYYGVNQDLFIAICETYK